MKDSYSEGVANHTDPESCGCGSNGMAGKYGPSIEPRNPDTPRCRRSWMVRKAISNVS